MEDNRHVCNSCGNMVDAINHFALCPECDRLSQDMAEKSKSPGK